MSAVAAAATFDAALLIASACTAEAAPPGVPNVDSYTPVDPNTLMHMNKSWKLIVFYPASKPDYLISYDTPGVQSSGTYFLTPDGISCAVFSGMNAICAGNNFPGLPPAAPTAGGTPRVNSISTAWAVRPSDTIGENNTVHGHPIKTLPLLHSISVGGVVCGVDDAGMTACKDPQGRGFVLSPKGSGWLPHV